MNHPHIPPYTTLLIRHWFNGGSALPTVRKLMAEGAVDEAAVVARMALRMDDCPDRDELEAVLHQCADTPAEWCSFIEEFAKSPSEERWQDLMRFVPEDVFYNRLKNMIRILMRLECDGNILFRCITRSGMISDVFDLVRTGRVDPEVIEERGEGSPARAVWLGLAAQASFVRGDRFGTIRYLREASRERSSQLALASIVEIRTEADDVLNAELDRAGVPK